MNSRKTSRIPYQVKTVALVVFCIGSLWAGSSVPAANLTTQTVTGIADLADEATQDWKELLEQASVYGGNIVRTDFGALVDLAGDDGSFISIGEASQLLIREFEFDAEQNIRIATFSLLEGAVSANAAHLDYATNIFEIETPTVVASFKFSKAAVTAGANGDSQVSMETGKFDLSREGKPDGDVLVNHTSQNDVVTAMKLPQNGRIEATTTDKGLALANIGNLPIPVTVGGQPLGLPPGGRVETTLDGGALAVKNTGGVPVDVGGQSVAPNQSVGGLPVTTVGECCQECEQQPSASEVVQTACDASPADCDKIKDAAIQAVPEAADEIRNIE